MAVNREEILKTAKLAKIHLDEKDIEEIYPHLNFIIEMMDKIEDIEKEDQDLYCVGLEDLREDKENISYEREIILKNSKDTKDGCFTVPKMIE